MQRSSRTTISPVTARPNGSQPPRTNPIPFEVKLLSSDAYTDANCAASIPGISLLTILAFRHSSGITNALFDLAPTKSSYERGVSSTSVKITSRPVPSARKAHAVRPRASSERNLIVDRVLLFFERFRLGRRRGALQMLCDEKILKGGGELNGKVAISRWNGHDRGALAVSAQLVAQKWKCLQDLVHESAPSRFGKVVEEPLSTEFFDQSIAVCMIEP